MKTFVALAVTVIAVVASGAASAYIGPGAGASLTGSLLGVLLAIVMAFGIVLLWPLRFVVRRLRKGRAKIPAAPADGGDIATDQPPE